MEIFLPIKKKLRSQLDKMTMSELLDIWSLDFDKMWFRIWISETGKKRSTRYWKKEAKFKKYFLERDNGKKIKKIVESAIPSELDWDLPRGHQNYSESTYDTAIRELREETGMQKKITKFFQTYITHFLILMAQDTHNYII